METQKLIRIETYLLLQSRDAAVHGSTWNLGVRLVIKVCLGLKVERELCINGDQHVMEMKSPTCSFPQRTRNTARRARTIILFRHKQHDHGNPKS